MHGVLERETVRGAPIGDRPGPWRGQTLGKGAINSNGGRTGWGKPCARANEMPLAGRALFLAGGGERVALLAGQGLAVEIGPAVGLDDDGADSGLGPVQIRSRRDVEALVDVDGDGDRDLFRQLDFGRIAEIGGNDGAAIDVDTRPRLMFWCTPGVK